MEVYIGITTRSLDIRKKEHIRDSQNENINTLFHTKIREYGEENFEWEVIDTVRFRSDMDFNDIKKKADELCEKEIKHIKANNSYFGWENSMGYNTTIRGNFYIGLLGHLKQITDGKVTEDDLTPEHVKEIKLLSRDTSLNRREISYLYNTSISNVLDILSEKIWTYIKIDDNEELPNSLRHYLIEYPKDKHEFYVYNIKNKEFVGKYTNQREAAVDLNIDHRNINSCLSGIKKPRDIILLYIKKF